MSIMGFAPSPETAAMVVAWVQALAEHDEETSFLCLECGADGRTEQAVREALGSTGADVSTLIGIDHPMPLPEVLSQARKRRLRLMSGLFRSPQAARTGRSRAYADACPGESRSNF